MILIFSDGHLQILITSAMNRTMEEELASLEHSLQQNPNIVGLGKLFVTEVPKRKPITRKQFDAAVKYWPVNFHEDKRYSPNL